jgi:hypothetical protein
MPWGSDPVVGPAKGGWGKDPVAGAPSGLLNAYAADYTNRHVPAGKAIIEDVTKPFDPNPTFSPSPYILRTAKLALDLLNYGFSPIQAAFDTTAGRAAHAASGGHIPIQTAGDVASIVVPFAGELNAARNVANAAKAAGVGIETYKAAQVGREALQAATRVPKPPGPMRKAADVARATAAPFLAGASQQAAERQAGEVLAKRAADPAAARASLAGGAEELVPGSRPTTFQQTGDIGLGALEREVATKNPTPFRERAGEQNAARVDLLQSLQEGGSPADLSRAFRSHFDDLDQQTTADVAARTAAAQAKGAAIGGGGVPESYGDTIRQAVIDAETAARSRESGLWEAIDPNGDLTGNVSATIQAAKEVGSKLPKTAKPMAGEEAEIFGAAAGLKPLSPVSDLIALRSRLSTAMRTELIANGRSPAYARMTRLRGAIQENLGKTISDKVAMDDVAVGSGNMAPDDAARSTVTKWVDAWRAGRETGQGAGRGAVADTGVGTPGVPGVGGTAGTPGLQPGGHAGDQGLPGRASPQEVAPEPPASVVADLRARGVDVQHMGEGPAGPILHGLSPSAWPATVDALSRMRTGDAHGALYHPSVGPIDVIWGSSEGGLQHIIEQHPEVVDQLPELLPQMHPFQVSANRIRMESPDHRAVVRLDYDKQDKTWLLSAFEREDGQRSVRTTDRGAPGGQAVSPDQLADPNIALPGSTANDAGAGPTFDAAAGQRLAEATEATKQRARTFGLNPVAPVTATQGAQGVFKLPDGRVPEKFFHPGPAGFTDMRALLGAGGQQVLPVIEDYAASSLRRAAMRDDGTIDPTRFSRWRQSHQDALRALPAETQARFADAAQAGQAVAEAAANRAAALKAAQGGAIGKVMGLSEPEDVTRAVGNILNGGTAVADMKALAGAAGRDPDAVAGLRQAIADHIANRLIGNTEVAASGRTGIRADAFQTFLRQKRQALAQVFTPEEIGRLDAIAADIQRAKRSENAIKLPGGPGTAQDLLAAQRGAQPRFLRITLDLLAGATGMSHGGPYVGAMAGVAADSVQALRDIGVARVQDLVTRAMLDPDVARALMARVDLSGPNAGRRVQLQMGQLLRALTVAGTASAGASAVRRIPPPRAREQSPSAAR